MPTYDDYNKQTQQELGMAAQANASQIPAPSNAPAPNQMAQSQPASPFGVAQSQDTEKGDGMGEPISKGVDAPEASDPTKEAPGIGEQVGGAVASKAGSAAGGAIGAAIGTALLPGIGTAIGGSLGSAAGGAAAGGAASGGK